MKTTGYDLKTTFHQTNYNMWNAQQYIYTKILEQQGFTVTDFIFAIVSKVKSSSACYFKYNSEQIDFGKEIVEKSIQKYDYCTENNIYSEMPFDYEKNEFAKYFIRSMQCN